MSGSLPRSASAFLMEATFHSKTQMQIQERLGLLLGLVTLNIIFSIATHMKQGTVHQ